MQHQDNQLTGGGKASQAAQTNTDHQMTTQERTSLQHRGGRGRGRAPRERPPAGTPMGRRPGPPEWTSRGPGREAHHANAEEGTARDIQEDQFPASTNMTPIPPAHWRPKSEELYQDTIAEHQKLTQETKPADIEEQKFGAVDTVILKKEEANVKAETVPMEDIIQAQPPRVTTNGKKYVCSVQELLRWSEDETWGVTAQLEWLIWHEEQTNGKIIGRHPRPELRINYPRDAESRALETLLKHLGDSQWQRDLQPLYRLWQPLMDSPESVEGVSDNIIDYLS
jgi:hypothetical protein